MFLDYSCEFKVAPSGQPVLGSQFEVSSSHGVFTFRLLCGGGGVPSGEVPSCEDIETKLLRVCLSLCSFCGLTNSS